VDVADDLTVDALATVLPGRPIRSYPAMLSTEADALAWARQGAPAGALVVADYQASPRGRAGFEWTVTPGETLAFSIVVRPALPPEREGWLYSAATVSLADVVDNGATIEWPDGVYRGGELAAAVGAQVEMGPAVVDWAVLSVLVVAPGYPRTQMVSRVVHAIEARLAETPATVLADYLPRSQTIGRTVRARMIPLGPGGPEVKGKAVGSLMDGALLMETPKGSRIAIRPQNLGLLEDWSPDQDP